MAYEKKTITENEMKDVYILGGGASDLIQKIKTIKPQRIYIDDYNSFPVRIIRELKEEFGDKIYAYGTINEM